MNNDDGNIKVCTNGDYRIKWEITIVKRLNFWSVLTIGYDHPREFESLSIRSVSGAKMDTRCVARVELSQLESTT